MTLEGTRSEIAAQLIDLEAGLRQLDLWADVPPAAEALQSEQPFAMESASCLHALSTSRDRKTSCL